MKMIKTLVTSGLALGMLINTLSAKEVDFEGKTIELIMPYNAGGGTDKWGRFYAPLLSQQLPGKPNIIIKNMPGGGSTKGANYFAERASKDGLTIFASSASTQIPFLLGDERIKYDFKDWYAVLTSPTGGVVYVSDSLGIKDINDFDKLKNAELKFGSQGPTSMDLIPLLAFDLLELNVQPVFGMKGRKEGRLAFLRGETNIDFQTSSAYLKEVVPALTKGKSIPLFSWGVLDNDGNLQRDPSFPELPHFGEVYTKVTGKSFDEESFKAWKTLFTASFPSQKMLVLPKDVSADVIETYENALKKVVSASDFKEKSEIHLGTYEQTIGEKANKLKDTATTVNKKDRDWIRNWLEVNHKVKF
ncbi:tricarboxylate transporter [bacterium]|jgi:tripartite-type tricarboxylate transporter receptor subunit TctC|nr:tricarboxylate transporter [bacterium]